MTITPSMMYWFTRLDPVHDLLCVFIFLCAIGFIATCISWIALEGYENEGVRKKTKTWFRFFSIAGLLCLLGNVFIPTSKQMAMIYVVPSITDSQFVKQDIPELYDLGVNALKDWLKKDEQNG